MALHKNPLVKAYLTFYNLASFAAWGTGLYYTIFVLATTQDFHGVLDKAFPVIKIVQTTMLLEIVHSIIGFVRAPFMTTLMQVLSRIFLVWAVIYPAPGPIRAAIEDCPAVSTMFIAWGITECVRYLFYAINLWSIPPWPLQYVRYTLFFVLYPMGAGSEVVVALWAAYHYYFVYPATELFRTEFGVTYSMIMAAGCLTYVPGFPKLFIHMIKQRGKVMRAHREEKKEAAKKKE